MNTDVVPFWSRKVLPLLVVPLAFVAALFVYPFLYGAAVSMSPKEGPWYHHYVAFFADPWYRDSLWITLRLAIVVTALAGLLAVPLAYVMRRRLPGEGLVTIALALPITLGTVLVAEGILGFLGPRGWLNQLLRATGLIDEPLRLTHNFTGVVIALFLNGFPMVFLMLLGFVSGIDPNVEHSARSLGASGWQVFRRIMLPLMAPGIAIASALNFVAAFSVFPSAVLVGQPAGETRVMAVLAYRAGFEEYDLPKATTIALLMGLVQLVILSSILVGRSRLYRGASMVGKG
jgi:putative spermidine/putrescine transport system permease protein